MQPEIARAARLALALGLAASAPSFAVTLGEARARSALGEPLDVRIPFTLAAGEWVDASCFALVREGDGPRSLGEGVLTIERRRGEAALRLRTVAPVFEPTLTLAIRAACPGREGGGTRQYTILVDARPAAALLVSAPSVIARLNAGSGETLESMAAKVYPRAGEARRRYVIALRELNPQFAAPGASVPEGAPIALPDPRTIRTAPLARRETAVAAAQPAPPPAPRRVATPRARADSAPAERAPLPRPAKEKPEPATPLAAAPVEAPAPAAGARAQKRAPAARAPASGPGFVLKLSSSEVDLSRSRQIDDRMRAQLRERLLVLDADDQVAAMLSMRNSLRQLEARVAEMQLKLDAMPASLAPRTAAMPPPAAPKLEAAPPKVEAPPPKVEAPPPKVEVAPPKVEAPPPKIEPVPPKIEPAPVAAAKTAPAAVPKAAESAKPVAAPDSRPGTRTIPRADESFELPAWLWGVAAALALLAAFLAWRLHRRRRAESIEEPSQLAPAAVPVGQAAVPVGVADDEPIEVAAEVQPAVGSDAVLATRLTENAGELRRRYIEERFPEIQNRTIVLDDPASVVKGARLFYEDGAMTRAVELLQFVIEERPQEVRPWLALFEIFRLERLPGEFATLAERFREHHGKGPYWRKVQYFGREVDPGNALYREEPINTLETIGPREAKRLAAGLSSVGATDAFDPVAENWLEAPMDFENEVLANELRMKLMAGASLTEQDLVPNPMPALRNIEMFTVA